MSNIQKTFENGKVVIAFITCGDPDFATTERAVKSAAENGADIIELGIPFSDPTAESPIIQESNLRALENGVTTDKIFDFINNIKESVSVELILKTYANVVFSYGSERFISACRNADISALLIPDIPFEEKDEFLPLCQKYGIALISAVSPAAPNRIKQIATQADGFIYILPCPEREMHGAKGKAALDRAVEEIKKYTDVPCVADFDGSVDIFEKNAELSADGVIVSTSITELLSHCKQNSTGFIGEYIRTLKNKLQ